MKWCSSNINEGVWFSYYVFVTCKGQFHVKSERYEYLDHGAGRFAFTWYLKEGGSIAIWDDKGKEIV